MPFPLQPARLDQLPTDPNAVAAEILEVAAAGEMTLFIGSFMSARPPAALPTATGLKGATLAGLWRGARSHLAPALGTSLSPVVSGSQWPELPLEMLMEAVLAATEVPVDRLLSFLGEAAPNYNHAVLAAMLDRGLVRIITTNFDKLIEVGRSVSGDAHGLSKPHGTLSKPDEMTVQLSQVGKRMVSVGGRRALERDLRDRGCLFRWLQRP